MRREEDKKERKQREQEKRVGNRKIEKTRRITREEIIFSSSYLAEKDFTKL